jgi:tRNA dimethylallyltransferase
VIAGPIIGALCVCGPTSSGKSDAALAAAEALDGEIINADSRQIYAGMRIGTGWPPIEAMSRVPHHLYGIISPADRYSAVRFVDDARAAIAGVAARGRLPILVGGTGFYIEALAGTMPIDRPAGGEEVRNRVLREALTHPQETLRAWLRALDPASATRVPAGDRYRTLRAIESALVKRDERIAETGAARDPRRALPKIRLTTVVLRVERADLRRRIAERVRAMFDSGLEEEATSVRARWPNAPGLTSIGYAEALAIEDGTATRSEAIARCTLRTSQYAARQETWFRRFRNARIVEAGERAVALRAVTDAARETAGGT